MLQRFRLLGWADGVHDAKGPNHFSETFVKDMTSCSEEFLRVVTAMVTERANCNIGDGVSLSDELENRVVQMLCSTKEPTHSVIGTFESCWDKIEQDFNLIFIDFSQETRA